MNRTKELVGGVLLAVATVVTWFAWLGWDTEYQTDPATGQQSGPYEAWQVVGCVLTLLAVGVIAALVLRPWVVVGVMTVAFTAAWSAQAVATDESGLWLVGALLVGGGTAVASAVVAFGVRRLRAG